jgi:hypothetical protein
VDLELHQLELRHADLRIRDAGRRRRLLAALAEQGQQVPVVVVSEVPRYVLIDGYLRVEALRQLGCDTVQATQWPLSEVDALVQHHHLSAASRSPFEQAWFLARLREQDLPMDELARRPGLFCRAAKLFPHPACRFVVYDGATGELELAFHPLGVTRPRRNAGQIGGMLDHFDALLRSHVSEGRRFLG